MRLRETGSIHLDAPRDRVFEILQRWMETEPGVRATPSVRIDAERDDVMSSFILRDAQDGGTQVIHARSEPPGLRLRPREHLREEVEAELARIERLVRVAGGRL